MRRNSFSVLFFINKTKLLKSGEAPIILRISVGGTRVECNIKRSVPVQLWDQVREISKGRDRKAAETNESICMLKLRALTINRDLELKGKLFTARLIMDMIYNKEDNQKTLLGIFRKHNDDS